MKIKWVISTLLIMLLMALSSSFISAGNIWRVSISSTGEQGNDGCGLSTISADGRFIAFQSTADNLVPGGKKVDVFVHDMWTGITERLSISSSGEEGNDWESGLFPSINADGRYVSFESCASNLVPNDTNNKCDIFVRDRLTGQTERVSISSTGIQGDGHSQRPAISADGRYVAFSSFATNLVSNDNNSHLDVFHRDRLLGLTTRVSVSSSGEEANSSSINPSISSDGRFVAFSSHATNLIPGDTNNAFDVFVHDLSTGITERVSISSTGEEGVGCSFASPGNFEPSISTNGRYVAFSSACIGLVPEDRDTTFDVYVHDRITKITERVSISSDGVEGNSHSYEPSISGDGRYVVFVSDANNLVPGDTNGAPDIFVHDRLTKRTKRVSISWDGQQANSQSRYPSISADGKYITFTSWASNLVPNDTNGLPDVFVVMWQEYPISLPKTGQTVSYAPGDDGDIQAGVAWPSPRFQDNGDGSITDRLTGLIWAKDAGTPTIGGCAGGTKSWQEALDYVVCLNASRYLGYSDWRVPNINELESLANAGEANLSDWFIHNGFTNVEPYIYWSSTTFPLYPDNAWTIDFRNSSISYYYKLISLVKYYIWPVRSEHNVSQIWKTGQIISYANGDDGALRKGIAWPDPRFIDNRDGTITDYLTGLMWLKDANTAGPSLCTPGYGKMWHEALDHVRCLNGNNYLGYNNWRLPNKKELLSLIDRSRWNPALIPSNPFTDVQLNGYWSSTTSAADTGLASIVNMSNGEAFNTFKSYVESVWPVRTVIRFEGPDIHVNPRTIDFENITVGCDSDKVVTASNKGNANLIIETITSPLPPFYKINDNCSGQVLTSGSQCTVSYRFSPSSEGSFSSSSQIPSNDPYEPNLTISLNGSSSYKMLTGVLRDAITGKPIPGVTISVGNFTAVTDSNGYYSISGLSCGTYTVTAYVSGYSNYVRTVDISTTSNLDILLTKDETVYGSKNYSGFGPDPVNTAIGNFIFQRKDIEIPGRGLSFVFERNYNSQDSQNGPLGYGWNHNYNPILTVNPDSTVTIRWGDSKTETWTPDGSGGFTPQYAVFDTLIDNGGGSYTLKKKDLTRYNFDTSGRLSSIVDKNGNTISLTYTNGNLIRITDTVGREINFTYDENNRIILITDPIGRTIQFTYDENGDLVSSTDPNGNTTTYTYDALHQMLTATDPRGNTFVTNTYDDEKRVVTSQRDAKGGQTTYIYSDVDRITTIIDQLGYTTVHYHDELLRLIQETDALGNSAHYTYDSSGNRTEVRDKNGNLTLYGYDSGGNVTSKTDPFGNITIITYDENNNPLSRTDALGNTTIFEYDANGNLIRTIDSLGNVTTVTYNSFGQPISITDPRGKTTTNAYDGQGNLVEVTDPLGNKTRYTYDGVGRRLTVRDALNGITTYTYDNNNNLLTIIDPMGYVTTYTYDANNNRITFTDPKGYITTYAYDVKNLLTTTTDPLGNVITNTYDALDRKISITDKRGNTINYTYDAVGNLTFLTDPSGNTTTYTYDPNGNKLTETNPLGQTVTYTYDALNRVTSITDPLGNMTRNTYDALGRVTGRTNAKGQTTTFEYDAMGRLTKVTDANGGTVTYTYDANGNRLSMTDPNGNTTNYVYDDLNKVIRKIEPLGGTYLYSYDAVGNRISLTDPKGNTINYTYDANNRLINITYPDTSTVTFEYDANGNRIRMVDKLGTSTYSYDALNRMTSYTDPFGKTVSYAYDANGNKTTLTYPDGKVVNYLYDSMNRLIRVTDWNLKTTSYNYDSSGNLTEILNSNNTRTTYTYDSASRLIGLANAKSSGEIISSYNYTLDPIGNHLQVVQNEPLNPVLTPKNITLTYDQENRLINAGGVTFTYDSNGNMTGKGTDTFSYDFEDRLIQSNIGGVVTQYRYDGLGNRLLKTVEGIATKYVLDVNGRLTNVIAETDNTGAITAYYVYGLGLISKVLPDGTTYVYHYDSRGSTVALTGESQNITDAYAYDSFGKLANSSGTNSNPFKYVGRYGVMDEGGGLSYVRARYYSPEIGRFLSKDPLTGKDRDGQSLNRYVYALNNSISFIDISGTSTLQIFANIIKGQVLEITKDIGEELYLESLRYGPWKHFPKSGIAVDIEGLGWFLKNTGIVLQGVFTIKDILRNAENLGISSKDILDALVNIVDTIKGAYNDPDALLEGLTEGFLTVSVICGNTIIDMGNKLSGGLLNLEKSKITVEDLKNFVELISEPLGEILYYTFWTKPNIPETFETIPYKTKNFAK